MRYFIVVLLLFFGLTSWSQTINFTGPLTDVCPDQTYIYYVSPSNGCTEITSVDCSGCYEKQIGENNWYISLKWSSGNVSRVLAASAMCTNDSDPNDPNQPQMSRVAVSSSENTTSSEPFEYSDVRAVSIKTDNNIYFCTMDAVSYYTTPQSAPGSENYEDHGCTTTAYAELVSYVDYRAGQNQTPFADFGNDVATGYSGNGGQTGVVLNWRSGWRGSVKMKIYYQTKKWKNPLFGNSYCETTGTGLLGTYTFIRNDELPNGTLSAPSTLSFNEAGTAINLGFTPSTPNVPISKIRFLLGQQQIYESPNYCGFNYTYTVMQPGKYSFSSQIQTPCGTWISGPNQDVLVISACHGVPSAISTIAGQTLTNGAYELSKGVSYNVQVSNLPSLLQDYNVNTDIGGDGQLSNNNMTFTINKEIGTYSITFSKKTGRDGPYIQCPSIPPISLWLGGKDAVIAQDKCPIELPADFNKFGFPVTPGSIVLEHFKGTVKSKTSIIVSPGLTLDLGAELMLEAGFEAPVNDLSLNFVEQTTYDEYGRISGENRNYYDYLGRPTQSQSKNLDAGVVLATQTIYDVYGRAALSTLPAPVSVRGTVDNSGCDAVAVVDQGLSFLFKDNFIKTVGGASYDYKAFDVSLSGETTITKEETPLAVENTAPGTLGWYYSANNGGATGDFAKINEPLVAATKYPYSRTLFHRDGTGETKGVTKPGDVFRAGAGNVAVADNESVLATDSYLAAYLDVYDEVYTRPTNLSGQFFRTVAYDEEDNQSMSYTDKGGKTIITLYLGKGTSPITTSYTIYDQVGRLKVSVSPNGIKQFAANVAFADIDKTTYTYNYKGWLLSTTEKDAGTTNYIYRRDGKIRFSQNAQQLIDQKFSYTNYDRSGRAVESGECTGVFSFAQATLESLAADGGFTGTRSDVTTTFYDEADPAIPGSRQQRFVHGAVSRSGNTNATTWYSYDERGRVEWVVQDIAGFGLKTLDYRYGRTGAVEEVVYQKGKKDIQGQPDEQFTHYYTYDYNGRLSKAYTTTSLLDYNIKGELTNSNVLTLQATYFYYLHGPLKRVEYAGNLQGIDYVYTADGALKSINDAILANDPAKDGHGTSTMRADVFGMTLDYYSGDYLSHSFVPSSSVTPSDTEDQFTGLIKANRWHSPIQGNVPVGYAYRYDARHQMRDARWLNTIPGITNPYYEHVYAEDVNGNEIDGYDANGNILSLNRKNRLGGNIADFSYKYSTYTNKLAKITTTGASPTDVRLYTYNAIGQMTEQEDAVTDKKLLTKYDVTGKVTEVRDENTNLITTYTYDDRGFRLSKTSYKDAAAKTKTWYVRDATGNMVSTYEDDLTDNNVPAPTEVPVYGSGRIGLYKPQFNLTFYELTDHLGNVRAVIGDHVTATYLATMESERADKEGDFIGITPRVISTGMNHTPSTVVIAEHNENTVIASPDEVIRINNGMDNPVNPVGGGILLPVHPQDKVDAEVFVRYTNFDGGINNSPLPGMAAYLAQSFGAPVSVIDGVNIFRGIDQSPNGVFSALGDTDDGLPQAFLTYVVYDRDMIPVLFDQVQAGTSAANGYQQLSLPNIPIDKEGFIYVYVSNQSPQNMEVFFDDLKVVHHYSDIVGGGDFYPFGLEINDRRITREKHRFGYQGLYAEKDEETGWNHFELREYDPVIGRFITPDPEGEFHSPYVGMGNNPVSGIDPTGGRTIPDRSFKGHYNPENGWQRFVNWLHGYSYLNDAFDYKNSSELKTVDYFRGGAVGFTWDSWEDVDNDGNAITRFEIVEAQLFGSGINFFEPTAPDPSDFISGGLSTVTKRVGTSIGKSALKSFLSQLPTQLHHFASNKNSIYTKQFSSIAKKFGLGLDGDWNKEVLRHLGRHPNKMHDFVLRNMTRAASEAGGNRKMFLNLYELYVKKPIRSNPMLLRKAGWPD